MGKCRDEIASGHDGPYLGLEWDRVFTDLSQPEKDRLKADARATNIFLQGFPSDIYKLINHNKDAKEIWENEKMLLEGSELTKDDHESQLYDEFEHFGQHKGEDIHDYYVWFTKLINDMRHIKMTMPKIQLNSKFVNNILPEWGRFMTAVKLNKGLRESNHDQLYAYLKQHEVHANGNKILLERLNQHSNDPLTLMSNVSPYQYSPSSSVPPQPLYIPSVTYQPQFANNTPLNIGLSLADELLDSLSKQGKQNMVQGNNARGDVAAGNEGAYNRAGNANDGQGKPIKSQENRVDLDKEQLLFLAGGQSDQCDAFDSDVDEASTAQTMFMANLSSANLVYDETGLSYDSDTLSKPAQYVPPTQSNKAVNVSLTAKLARYKELAEDDHDEMIKHFSKLEVEHLNLQLKYQHLKERFGIKKSVTSLDAPVFEQVFVIRNLKEQLQGRGNTIKDLKEKISCLHAKHSDADPNLDFKALDSQNKDLTVKVNALQDLNEHLGQKMRKLSSITRNYEIENLKAQIKEKMTCVTRLAEKPKVLAPVEAHWKEIHFRRTVPIRFTKSKVVPVRQPETGSTSDIGIPERLRNTSHKPLTRYQRKNKQEKTTSTGIPTIAETQTTDSSVIYNVVSTNQHDPNKN
ncbi:hypothetical protein Tco_0769855 [Tanacetum coccineum]|uniref:Integrase, catalytic region, zinc finger, CCHC-type, peptidase aspartic, catalytic n=1 Tax=Tanacetum coccineum TaxID=301880 RepID=A0ABQ4ZAJ5_9ASTR